MRRAIFILSALTLACCLASKARAVAIPGDVALDFFKPELWTNVNHDLLDYRGKVVVLFELGYN